MQTFFLDTETTGLHPPHDKLVEVAIVADDGGIALDTLVNPKRAIGLATQIHGISDEMVETAPTMETLWPQIRNIITDNHVVIYNAQFDTRFFPDQLNCAAKISCAMLRFAPIYGEMHPYHGNYTWQKLTTAATCIDYEWAGNAHRALADALATRALWIWMESKEFQGKYSPV